MRQKETERALAHVEKIEWVKPIDGADNIELIGILGWVCIAKKEEFKPGDLAIYIEIDSKCPSNDERFAFLESNTLQGKDNEIRKVFCDFTGFSIANHIIPRVKGYENWFKCNQRIENYIFIGRGFKEKNK